MQVSGEAQALVVVVAAALVGPDGRVLMQCRPAGKAHGGLWEFPGGKVEPGESPQGALVREIAEELGIVLSVDSLVPVTFAADPVAPAPPRASHLLLLFSCRDWTGEPVCIEAEALQWVEPERLAALAMPPLDYPLAEGLVKSFCKNAK